MLPEYDAKGFGLHSTGNSEISDQRETQLQLQSWKNSLSADGGWRGTTRGRGAGPRGDSGPGRGVGQCRHAGEGVGEGAGEGAGAPLVLREGFSRCSLFSARSGGSRKPDRRLCLLVLTGASINK